MPIATSIRPEAHRDGREDEVEAGGEGELDPRQELWIHRHLPPLDEASAAR